MGENSDIYKVDGYEFIVGGNFKTGKCISFPINHEDMDIYGQVTNNRESRLDPSDAIQIDGVSEYIYGSEHLGIFDDYDSFPDLTGVGVSGSQVVSLYEEIIFRQEMKNSSEQVEKSDRYGFSVKESLIYD